jgi:tryptophan 2,3-dioxygenase
MSGCPFADQGKSPGSPHEGEARLSAGGVPSILGFQSHSLPQLAEQNAEGALSPTFVPRGAHYSSYLHVGTLLNLQNGESQGKPEGSGIMHHEEMMFIIVHQVSELWFKLIMHDLSAARDELVKIPTLPEGEFHLSLARIQHYCNRCTTVLPHVADAMKVMETMHPADFLEFRDFLIPASGFQSASFRMLEGLLGIKDETRPKVNGLEVLSVLTADEQARLAEKKKEVSLSEAVLKVLSSINVPDSFADNFVQAARKVLEMQQFGIAGAPKNDRKAKRLIDDNVSRITATLADPAAHTDGHEELADPQRSRFRQAVLGGLFVETYRMDPRCALLAACLDSLVAVESGILLWRERHAHMAERMIGRRSGTGGTSSGVGYLEATAKHRMFAALWLGRRILVRSTAQVPLSQYGEFPLFATRGPMSPMLSPQNPATASPKRKRGRN